MTRRLSDDRAALSVDDPILPMKDAAIYLGFRGKQPHRTLYKLVAMGQIRRDPMPGTGERPRFGIRRSVLNAYLESLRNARFRRAVARRPIGVRDSASARAAGSGE